MDTAGSQLEMGSREGQKAKPVRFYECDCGGGIADSDAVRGILLTPAADASPEKLAALSFTL